MLIDELKELLKGIGNFQTSGKCVDCGRNVAVNIIGDDEQMIIDGGAIFKPKESFGYQDKYVFKCDSCYAINSKINQRTEVYTRVVGYLRPINQMNPGKLSEIDQREMFDMATI
jgi:hypothetical protein